MVPKVYIVPGMMAPKVTIVPAVIVPKVTMVKKVKDGAWIDGAQGMYLE